MTTSNFNNKSYGGRMHFPATPQTSQQDLPPGYIAHANGSGFIVSVPERRHAAFLRDARGEIKRFATKYGMESYCKKHAEQRLKSDEVPV